MGNRFYVFLSNESEKKAMKKYKEDIIFWGLITALVALTYYLASVILPFIIGLTLAFAVKPLIKRIQKIIPNWNMATTLFLLSTLTVFIITIFLFATQISHDFKRLNNAFRIYAESNSEMLDKTAQKVKTYIDKVYTPEKLKEQLGIDTGQDSLNVDKLIKDVDKDQVINNLDIEAIKKSLNSLTSFFQSNSEEDIIEKEDDTRRSLNGWVVFFSSIGYFLYIVYTLRYFDKVINKYFNNNCSRRLKLVLTDVKRTFLSYFKQRSKIIAIYMLIFVIAFIIIGLPGAIIIGIIAGLLCFIPYLQYITLVPIALGCLILSIETGNSFLLYFGITFAVFVFTTLLEELYLYDKIMKDVSGMNPAVMMVCIAVWGYLLGTIGVVIALPLSSLIFAYVKRLLLAGKD